MNIFIISSKEFEDKLPTIMFNLHKLKHTVNLPTFQLGKTSAFINQKTEFLKKDIKLLEKSDSILCCNFKKKNIDNYIGNTMIMYIAIAFYLNKKIYILYDIPNTDNKDEIKAIEPICLNADLKKIKD
jgi:hypothetical protein